MNSNPFLRSTLHNQQFIKYKTGNNKLRIKLNRIVYFYNKYIFLYRHMMFSIERQVEDLNFEQVTKTKLE